jgi:histone H3/H4
MIPFTVLLDEAAAGFYLRVAQGCGKSVETVLSETLFKLAGELSLQALHRKREKSAPEGKSC